MVTVDTMQRVRIVGKEMLLSGESHQIEFSLANFACGLEFPMNPLNFCIADDMFSGAIIVERLS